MAKKAPQAMLDAFLDYAGDATTISACSQEPTTRTEAHSTYMLATAAISGSPTKGNGTGGARKLTIPSQSDMDITNAGSATHIALYDGSVIRYVTTCPTQALVSGGKLNLGSWEITIGQAT